MYRFVNAAPFVVEDPEQPCDLPNDQRPIETLLANYLLKWERREMEDHLDDRLYRVVDGMANYGIQIADCVPDAADYKITVVGDVLDQCGNPVVFKDSTPMKFGITTLAGRTYEMYLTGSDFERREWFNVLFHFEETNFDTVCYLLHTMIEANRIH